MNINFAPIIAAALFSWDLPEHERVARLKNLFSPAVGEHVQLDPTELRDFVRTHKPTNLRGFIRVKPPKGVCLTIQRRDDEPDERVCKEQNLAFTVTDLRHDGSLVWLVKTGDGDFGTPLSWPSRYRLVLMVADDAKPDAPPKRRFLHACEPRRLEDGERRIILRFIDGGYWTIKFPPNDTLVPNQPDPIPYLDLQGAKKRTTPVSTSTATQTDTSHQANTASDGHSASGEHGGAEHSSEKPASGSSDHAAQGQAPAEANPKPRKPVDDEEEEAKWHIPKLDTYEMSASNFMPYGSVASAGAGKCRYRYRGDDVDPRTPMVECRDADGFAQVIIPVTCLQRP